MTDSQDRPKAESFPYDCGSEGPKKKDDVPFEELEDVLRPNGEPESDEPFRQHHRAGRRPLFRN